MASAAEDFSYDESHGVLVCLACATCLVPRSSSWAAHLRAAPHRKRGAVLRGMVEKFGTYSLRSEDELRAGRPAGTKPCEAVAGLATYAGYRCTHDGCAYCTRRLDALKYKHLPGAHGLKAKQHSVKRPLWRACLLQTYFTAKGRIDYFVVCGHATRTEEGRRRRGGGGGGGGREAAGMSSAPTGTGAPGLELFNELEEDARRAEDDAHELASTVQGSEGSRSARIPWLESLGFPAHLRGLKDAEIKASYCLPPARALGGVAVGDDDDDDDDDDDGDAGDDDNKDDGGDADSDLARMLAAADAMLHDAYGLCSDTSPGRRMTQQRADILNEFYAGAASRKAAGFRPFKNQSTLATYFRRMKELLAYFYTAVYLEGGHFTRARDDQVLPCDVISPTDEQMSAMDELLAAVRRRDRKRRDDQAARLELNRAARRFYMALICHDVGGQPFQSPVLSFCAMHSRRVYSRGWRKRRRRRRRRNGLGRDGGEEGEEDEDEEEEDDEEEEEEENDDDGGDGGGDGEGRGRTRTARGGWAEPGNYNSTLSALTWTAQMVMFDHVCAEAGVDGDGRVPAMLRELCQRFFQQLAETPFGYILQWRLYLFVVSKKAIAKHQARWSMDGQTVEFRGVALHMDQIPQLVASEYRRAHALLYGELMLGAADELPPVESWRLQDDLDDRGAGGSWLTDPRNATVLRGTGTALLHRIRDSPELQRAFLKEKKGGSSSSSSSGGGGGGMMLCPKAIEVYEAYAQDFLGSMALLCHVPPGPPLRAPELLSVTVCNAARQRHVYIWEKLVMLYVQYHKGQEQSGAYKDNIRFLPKAVGDLLLTYLAYVRPLRQTFLRQLRRGAVLSPYLWSSLDGSVWKDGRLSVCLRRACARGKVPRFQTAWWRQVAASITKEKFAARDRANFGLEDGDGAAAGGAEDVEDELDLVHLAKMSNHSFHTFNHAYAGATTLAMSTLLHRSYRASESWRALFRLDPLLCGKRPRGGDDDDDGGGGGGTGLGIAADCKRARFYTRRGHGEAEVIAAARRLYGDPGFRYRTPGQRDAVLATLGPQFAEQVIVVLATGSGKTLVVMVGAMVGGSGGSGDDTTILVLPTVALRRDMVRRLADAGIRAHVWSVGSARSAPVVVVSAEAACTEGFLAYARRLVDRQQLARIVVDECHLTVTASSYRRSMSQLAWHVRQVRTQTVWLTATLPPSLQAGFIEHNLLVRPLVVRESTNRPNIRYTIQRGGGEGGGGSLCERAVRLVRSHQQQDRVGGKDKIILYCQSKEQAAELAGLLGCPSYTADSGSERERDAVIAQWLDPSADTPAIVATSALGVGFDYPQVRCVVHVGAPGTMTDFSQESGRAGRDGLPAESIVLLGAGWEPDEAVAHGMLPPDREAIQVYLAGRHCARGVMSQFLDAPSDWRWCMGGDQPCGFCGEPHVEARPAGLAFSLREPAGARLEDEDGFTGPSEVLRQACVQEAVLSRYEKDFETMSGCCLYCRACGGRPFDHAAAACSRRTHWIRAKQEALRMGRSGPRGAWIEKYVVCWRCYQPQEICRAADPEAREAGDGEAECRFPDMVMPLCYGAYCRSGRTAWFREHFQRQFSTQQEYMLWLGESASLGGVPCIQANRVAALLMPEFG